MMRYALLWLFIGLPYMKSYAQTLLGQDSSNRAITTAVPFLILTPDSRAAGMGDVGVATSADNNSAYWNAGKLAFVEQTNGVSFSYTPWLSKVVNDMFVVYLSGFYKIKEVQTIALSMKYFNIGEVFFNTGPDINQQIGRFNPREFAFDVAYSRKLSPYLGLGGAIRYIHSNMTGNLSLGSGNDAKPGNSVAVDIGVFFSKPSTAKKYTIAAGAAITNIGPKMSYSDAPNSSDFIPTNLRIGGAYTRHIDPLNHIQFAMDVNKLMVPSPGPNSKNKNLLEGIFGSFGDARGGFSEEIREFTLSTGIEYSYKKAFFARLGYFLEAEDKGNRKYATLGVGAKIKRFGMDVAYMIPTNEQGHVLSETIRFTLDVHFGQYDKEKSEKSSPSRGR